MEKGTEHPSQPGRPILIPLSDQQPDVITLKWEKPTSDGGSPILGYIIEHRRMGSPHWVRATPSLVVRCEVSISGLEPGWRYQFRAIAENVVGKSDPSELSDALTVTLQRNAITVPRFISELKDTNAVENERVELKVGVVGQPQPEISWFKDGFEIFSSRRTKIVNDNDFSVLIIHQVSLTDEGEIKCTATNRAGHVVTKAKLKIEAPPKIRLPRNYEDGLIVEADEVLRLKVGLAGQPIPNVIWSHEGEIIKNSGRFELETTEKNSSLKINNVKRSDRGEYNIRAVNKLGEDIASFLVTVTARPKPPGKVKLNMSFGKSATLSWTAPEDDGGCKIGNYIVEYYRIGWDVWLKAATTRQLSATLHDLIEGSEYKFRVKAENPYGLSEPSVESDVLFIPDPKRSANKQEESEKLTPEKSVPPRRQPLSPTRNTIEAEPNISSMREVSPKPQQSNTNIVKPELYESEQLNMEMSYGTPNNIVDPIRKSSSGGKIGNLIERKHSLSPIPVNEKHVLEKRSPSPSKRLDVGQKIAQFFKRSPSPARKIIPPEEDQSVKIPSINLTPEIERKIEERLQLEREKDKATEGKSKLNHSPSQQLDELEKNVKTNRSAGLERSQEPVNFDAIKAVQEAVEIKLSQSINTATGAELLLKNNIKLSEEMLRFRKSSLQEKPSIEISAPENELPLPSDSEKRDEVHTSNEFMLVLYPNKNAKDNEKQESFDLALEDALSPPQISLSFPELSTMDQYLMPIQIRRSVSSTELLYERAMARFYEAVELEEAEKDKKLKKSQEQLRSQSNIRKRLGSISEAERLSFERRTSRRRSADISQEFLIATKWDSKENSMFSKYSQILTEEQSQHDEDDKKFNEGNNVVKGISVEYESDYTESTASDSEESMEKFKMELIARTRSTSAEISTYHSRRMSDETFSPYRSPTPDQSSVILTKPAALPSPDFVPKPILKRPSIENIGKEDSSNSDGNRNSDGNHNSDRNINGSINLKKPSPEKKEKGKGFKAFFKRDKNVSNSQKDKSSVKANANLNQDSMKKNDFGSNKSQTDVENKKKTEEKMKLEAQKSAEEESKVVVDYYSNIVQELGRSAKTKTPLYLDSIELKKAAEKAEKEESELKIGDIDVDEEKLFLKSNARPRLSLVERLQSQHVQIRSRSALEKPKSIDEDGDEEKLVTEAVETVNLRLENEPAQPRGRTVIKTKKIIKKRNPSKTNSRDTSVNKVQPASEEITSTKKEILNSTKKHTSRSRKRNESKSPASVDRNSLLTEQVKDALNNINIIKKKTDEFVQSKTLEEIADEAQETVHSAVSYMTDVGLFVVACWVYIFKDARLVLPILALMVYRQIGEAINKRIPDWMRKKKS